MSTPAIRADLAPSGTMRVGVNHSNPILSSKNPTSGELSGLIIDLSSELARRAGVQVEFVGYDTAGKMVEGLKQGAWDIAWLAVDPARATEIDFTAPHIVIEGTYLVPARSTFRTVAEVDRSGIRIGTNLNSAYDLYLARSLQHAQRVTVQNPDAVIDLLASGKADVIAGVRQALEAHARRLPELRVLEDRFMAINQAAGIVKGRDAGAKYLRDFVEEAKATGLVAQALERAGIRDVSVVPLA
jgi:polar amino acid transport system substrate-binding protein